MTITILTKARVTCGASGCEAFEGFNMECIVDYDGRLCDTSGYGWHDILPPGWAVYQRCGHRNCRAVFRYAPWGAPHLCPKHAAVHAAEVAKDAARKGKRKGKGK